MPGLNGLAALIGAALSLAAQTGGPLAVTAPARTAIARNSAAEVRLSVRLAGGYHVNSNTPADEYLIPLKLTWDRSPLEVQQIVYPVPKMEKYSFSSKPLSVYTGDFEILTRFKAPVAARPGALRVTGKLRYQACTRSSCLPPRTVDVTLPVEIQAR